MPVEVELQRKSLARLRGILGMYKDLATGPQAPLGGVIYVTASRDIADAVTRAAQDVGLGDALLTLRCYPDVVDQARAAAATRGGRPAGALERPGLGDVA